jgi:hypothetical protein
MLVAVGSDFAKRIIPAGAGTVELSMHPLPGWRAQWAVSATAESSHYSRIG